MIVSFYIAFKEQMTWREVLHFTHPFNSMRRFCMISDSERGKECIHFATTFLLVSYMFFWKHFFRAPIAESLRFFHVIPTEDWYKKWRFKVNQSKSTRTTTTLNLTPSPAVTLYNTRIPSGPTVKYTSGLG